MEHKPPPATLIENMVIASAVALSIGLVVFAKLKRSFYEYI
jgi:hypothetical protein